MRILVISDIHANFTAFEAVLKDAGSFDAVWHLWHNVVECFLPDLQLVLVGAVFHDVKGIVENTKCNALLAVPHKVIDETCYHRVVITRVCGQYSRFRFVLTHCKK